MNEETIYDKNVAPQNPQQKKNEKPQDAKVNPSEDKVQLKEGKGKKATVAAAAGVATVGAGLLMPKLVFPHESGNGHDEIDAASFSHGSGASMTSGNHDLTGHELEVATGVDDSMSFDEAFATAREEVGPGGVFSWHGNTYGTYYGSEWNAMSPEDKEQYWADVNHTTTHLNDQLVENNVDGQNPGEVIPTEPNGGWETDPNEPTQGDPNEPTQGDPNEPLIEPTVEPLGPGEPVAFDPVTGEPIFSEPEPVLEPEPLEPEPVAYDPVTGEPILSDPEPTMGEPIDPGEPMVYDPIEPMIPNIYTHDPNNTGIDPNDTNGIVPSDDPSACMLDSNPDVDALAANIVDPNIPIDNGMDMSDFV